jgi:hypothetical protein
MPEGSNHCSKRYSKAISHLEANLKKEMNVNKNHMNKNHWITVALAVLILALCVSTALAQDPSKGPPPFPPPPVQSLVDNGYLYVLIGPSVLQYDDNMTLQNMVSLPAPEGSKQVISSSQKPPMPPMLSMVTDGKYLYLVSPGYVFQYSLPDLVYQKKKALPKPEAPK